MGRKIEGGMRTPLIEKIFSDIEKELGEAKRKHPEFPSIHHGISVIREEYLELEKVAFTNGIDTDPELQKNLYKEAIQLATTCVRLLSE